MQEEQVRAQYDRWLGGWTPVALYVRWYLRYGGAHYATDLFSALGTARFARVLDVGCATGPYLVWAWRNGHGRALLAGVDINPHLLDEARRRLEPARNEGATVALREASATALPFPDESFDAVICSGVVKYLDDAGLDALLSEVARVLAPEGRFAVAEFGRLVAEQARFLRPQRLGIPVDHLRTERDLRVALERIGYTEVSGIQLERLRRLPLTYEGAVGTAPQRNSGEPPAGSESG